MFQELQLFRETVFRQILTEGVAVKPFSESTHVENGISDQRKLSDYFLI